MKSSKTLTTPVATQALAPRGRGGRCSLSLAARTLALSALAPSGTGTIGSGPMVIVVREAGSINPTLI
jgi:hypothetical protein